MQNNSDTTSKVFMKFHRFYLYSELGRLVLKKYVIEVTPRWFEFLQWIVVLGFLKYISVQAHNSTVLVLYRASFVMLFYFTMIKLEFSPLFKRWPFLAWLFSLMLIFYGSVIVNEVIGVITLLH